jgi:twitching motility protein PilT
MELKDYIHLAIKQEAVEMVFAPGELPRFRIERDWQVLKADTLKNPSISPAQTRLWAFQLCNEEDKKRLIEGSPASGSWEMLGQKLMFEIHPSGQGFILQMQWFASEWRDAAFWTFPKWTHESLARGRGIHVFVSPDIAVLEGAVEGFLSPVTEQKKSWIVWNQSDGMSQLRSNSSLVTYQKSIPKSCDIVVLEGFKNAITAVEESEKGRGVVLMLQHHNLFQTLSRICKEVGSDRFAPQLRLAMSLKALYGLNGWVPVFDLLANTTSVEQALLASQFSVLENLMKDSEKDTGMRTLNQSLLQLMIKRKIDFKKGFEISPAPAELDLLLKQVGI